MCLKISILFPILATFPFLASNPKTTDGTSQHLLSDERGDRRRSILRLFGAVNVIPASAGVMSAANE